MPNLMKYGCYKDEFEISFLVLRTCYVNLFIWSLSSPQNTLKGPRNRFSAMSGSACADAQSLSFQPQPYDITVLYLSICIFGGPCLRAERIAEQPCKCVPSQTNQHAQLSMSLSLRREVCQESRYEMTQRNRGCAFLRNMTLSQYHQRVPYTLISQLLRTPILEPQIPKE